jgi:hypothetical protein
MPVYLERWTVNSATFNTEMETYGTAGPHGRTNAPERTAVKHRPSALLGFMTLSLKTYLYQAICRMLRDDESGNKIYQHTALGGGHYRATGS